MPHVEDHSTLDLLLRAAELGVTPDEYDIGDIGDLEAVVRSAEGKTLFSRVLAIAPTVHPSLAADYVGPLDDIALYNIRAPVVFKNPGGGSDTYNPVDVTGKPAIALDVTGKPAIAAPYEYDPANIQATAPQILPIESEITTADSATASPSLKKTAAADETIFDVLLNFASRGISEGMGWDPTRTVSAQAAEAAAAGIFWGTELCAALDAIDPGHCQRSLDAEIGALDSGGELGPPAIQQPKKPRRLPRGRCGC